MIQTKYLLRDYQEEMIARVREAWKQHRSVMVQMPTGTGKTHVLAAIVNNRVSGGAGKVLVVAHRIELVAQIRETVDAFFALAQQHVGNFAKALDDIGDRIKVESIQTVARRIDSLDFTPDLVVIDEAHHALAKTYRILWEKWPKAKFLGLTATPCRMNKTGFTDLFDELITSWSIAKFIEQGVLSVFDYVSIRPNSEEQRLIDMLQKRGADGDYQVKEMDEVLNKRPSIERLYQSVEQFAKGKKGIVYAISINHARQIAEHYSRMGLKAVAIDSQTPREERKRLVNSFKQGELQVLVNVDVFSEGFDCPDVEFVQMARPTLSLAKYLQQVGRGLRKSEGKVACVLIDNVGLYRVFGLPVLAWDWEAMFRGEASGKAVREAQELEEIACTNPMREMLTQETDLRLVVSHDALLANLNELSRTAAKERKMPPLKAWMDAETGRWGLKRGRKVVVEADYVRVFDIQDEWAAVRFSNHTCGVVDATGKVIWKIDACQSMKFMRNDFVVVQGPDAKECYLDLRSLQLYAWKPEVKRWGNYELLKVRHTCFSRTKEVFVSHMDYEGLMLADKGFYLAIFERVESNFCLLAGDEERYYRMCRKLADGSIVVADSSDGYYHVEAGKEKVLIGRGACQAAIERLAKEVQWKQEAVNEERKRQVLEEYRNALPCQIGLKWGLKVGNRLTIPPIYRKVQTPVGKYCAVEMNYGQWGVVAIDGTVLVEPKYPEVAIERNGTVVLTGVTGKKETIQL